MQQLLALIGPGCGPWQYVSKLRNLRLAIAGLKDGCVGVSSMESADDELTFLADGVYDLEPSKFKRVQHEGSSATVICRFLGD